MLAAPPYNRNFYGKIFLNALSDHFICSEVSVISCKLSQIVHNLRVQYYITVKADDKAENAYMGLEVPGTDRQDSGIEVDNNSTKSKQEVK